MTGSILSTPMLTRSFTGLATVGPPKWSLRNGRQRGPCPNAPGKCRRPNIIGGRRTVFIDSRENSTGIRMRQQLDQRRIIARPPSTEAAAQAPLQR